MAIKKAGGLMATPKETADNEETLQQQVDWLYSMVENLMLRIKLIEQNGQKINEQTTDVSKVLDELNAAIASIGK